MNKTINFIPNDTHFLSVDLEDWHTSAYLRDYVTKQNFTDRIEESTQSLLNVFKKHQKQATFFVLGSVAEKFPALIHKIHRDGHEIASHGYSHTPLWKLNKGKFEEEIVKTNQVLSSITNKKIKGFRAPYASLDKSTSWAIDILEKHQFLYDSSIFPMKTPLYGIENVPFSPYKISSKDITKNDEHAQLIEIPFTIWNTPILNVPCTGAIYCRFYPQKINKFILQQIAKRNPINFYFHPWEIDVNIPRIKTPLFNKLVSYYNVTAYLPKIEGIIKLYNFTSFEKKLNI